MKQVKTFLNILKNFNNVYKIFTSSNSDAYGLGINNLVHKFTKRDKNSILIKTFGKDDYLSLIRHVNCVVGNSSSGIIEVPVLKKPTLTALYPLLSFDMTSKTLPFSIFITVTGTDWPVSINSLVIPNFVPINPMLINYILISMSTPDARSNFIKASTV